MDDKLVVKIADMQIARQNGMLITYALGSCIGICLYDATIKLAAMVHIMLPLNMEPGRANPFKYADTGIAETLKQMERQGGMRARMTAKIAGGAKMFDIQGKGAAINSNIGMRNIECVHQILKREGIKLLHEEVGGGIARTLLFDAATGNACVRSFGHDQLVF